MAILEAMPYIKPEHRVKIDADIEALAKKISDIAKEDGDEGAYAGLLNYTITRLSLRVAINLFGGVRYKIGGMLSGVWNNVSEEFYDKVMRPYEDKQAAKNGNVPEYEELLGSMKK